MSRSNVTLYLDNDRLKKLATERSLSASALVEQALDLLEATEGVNIVSIDHNGYKIRVVVDQTE